ncbi:MAG: DUF2207 domain-containing protein [Actinomycetia bacterium]|nr:DUF2207 domain-containing protein [Actinomycetes bacterium]
MTLDRLRRSLLALLVGLILILVLVAAPVLAQDEPGGSRVTVSDGQEHIRSFDAVYEVSDDGSVVVTETIVYDFGFAERRGIFRDLVVSQRYDDAHDRKYPFSLISVTGSPGTPVDVKLEDSDHIQRIRIGDPDTTITGSHTYVISYRLEGMLHELDGRPELFWNAIADWPVPIVTARVTVEGPVADRATCFAGVAGSGAGCAGVSSQGGVVSFEQPGLSSYEGLTIVVGWSAGALDVAPPVLEARWSLGRAFTPDPEKLGLGALSAVVGVGLVGNNAWRRGRDRRAAGSVVDLAFATPGVDEKPVPLIGREAPTIEFAPPENIRPGQLGVLHDETVHTVDVSATIIDLAVRGHLRIDQLPKADFSVGRLLSGNMSSVENPSDDHRLVLLGADRGRLRPYERLLLEELEKFEHIGTPAYESGPDIPEHLLRVPPTGGRPWLHVSELSTKFASNMKALKKAMYEDVVDEGWFADRPDKVRTRWVGIGLLALVVGIGLFVVIVAATTWGWGVLPLPIVGALLLITSRFMPRRTPVGTGLDHRVGGFRRFIVESEAHRAGYAERAHLFSEYLPYAMVFGVVDQWAKTFDDLDLDVSSASGWYTGGMVYGTPFRAAAFASSVDSFATTTSTTMVSTPGGSGSSGFSGGSVGGGGGGGGGGSW